MCTSVERVTPIIPLCEVHSLMLPLSADTMYYAEDVSELFSSNIFSPCLGVQATARKELTVTIPSEYMPEEWSFFFRLRVDTELGGSSEVGVPVYKSSTEQLVSKVSHLRHLFIAFMSSLKKNNCISPTPTLVDWRMHQ